MNETVDLLLSGFGSLGQERLVRIASGQEPITDVEALWADMGITREQAEQAIAALRQEATE